jgi:hypothetical protein
MICCCRKTPVDVVENVRFVELVSDCRVVHMVKWGTRQVVHA